MDSHRYLHPACILSSSLRASNAELETGTNSMASQGHRLLSLAVSPSARIDGACRARPTAAEMREEGVLRDVGGYDGLALM